MLNIEGLVSGAATSGLDACHQLLVGNDHRTDIETGLECTRKTCNSNRSVLLTAPVGGREEPGREERRAAFLRSDRFDHGSSRSEA